MNSIEKLLYELKPVKIYDAENASSLIRSELESYARVLDEVQNNAEKLKSELFLETSSDEGLKRFKTLYGIGELDSASARKYISSVCAMPFGFTNREMYEFEKAFSAPDAVISEDKAQGKIVFENFSALSFQLRAAALRLLRKYAPCHLQLVIASGFGTWDEIEAQEYDFSSFEALSLTFNEIENVS